MSIPTDIQVGFLLRELKKRDARVSVGELLFELEEWVRSQGSTIEPKTPFDLIQKIREEHYLTCRELRALGQQERRLPEHEPGR